MDQNVRQIDIPQTEPKFNTVRYHSVFNGWHYDRDEMAERAHDIIFSPNNSGFPVTLDFDIS